MAKITGRVEVLVNGVPLLNKEEAKINGVGISGQPAVERVQVFGDSGSHGFIEKPVEASCEVTITDRDDVLISDLMAVNENGTIIFRANGGGKVYTADGATAVMNVSITAGEGETPLKFVVPFWTESVETV